MSRSSTAETKYLVINTRAKWQAGFSQSLRLNSNDHLLLASTDDIIQPEEDIRASGIACDSSGDFYIIDRQACRIYKYLPEPAVLTQLECLGGCGIPSGQFHFSKNCTEFSGGVAVSKSVLYLADSFNHRIQAFDLAKLQIRFILGKEAHCQPVSGTGRGEFNQPKDIVVDCRGNFFVLDLGNLRIQKFNRFGKFRLTFGGTSDPHLTNPHSFTIDKENCLLVIDAATSSVEKFNSQGEWLERIIDFTELEIPLFTQTETEKETEAAPIIPSGIAADAAGNIYIGESAPRDDLKIYRFDQNGRFLGTLGSYSENCFKLAVDPKGQLFGSCGPRGRVINFHSENRFEKTGTYWSQIFDSTISRCRWHRLKLNLQTGDHARIDLFVCAADDQTLLNDIEDEQWRHFFSSPMHSLVTTEALFPEVTGRYLRLKFQFSSNGTHSYRVKSARIFFERLSYLRFLPGVFQEDEASRKFLEHFLSLFETMSGEIEDQINHITRYFDPRIVDSKFLDWLGTWLAILQDDNWPDAKQRKLLQKAFQLYKLRGTIPGLKQIVELLTEKETVIIEHFRLKAPMIIGANSTVSRSTVVGRSFTNRLILEESSTIGAFRLNETKDPPEKPFEADAYNFTILADTSALNQNEIKALYRLVEAEKPAHTQCCLRTSENAVMQLGYHAFLEVDTRLSNGFKPLSVGLRSQLGNNTFLGSKYSRKGTVGQRSQIAYDAILN